MQHRLHCSCALTLASLLAVVSTTGCQQSSTTAAQVDTRPLEEAKALDIIRGVLSGRKLAIAPSATTVELWNRVRFNGDLRLAGEPVVIEFLTEENRLDIGEIPPPAPGSRLHVLAAQAVSDSGTAPEKIYLLVLDSRRYVYQYNPTSESRADVTYAEVAERLQRDLTDFLSWWDTEKGKRKES